MKTTTIDPDVLQKIEDCNKHGIKLSLADGRIRLHWPERGNILHSDRLEDVPQIDNFVAEGFRKFILIALLSEQNVPGAGDYSEAYWENGGHEFLGHGGCFIDSGSFYYSVSLSRTSLNWSELWNWPFWPNAADIRSRYDKLLNNYQATLRLIAYVQGRKLDYHFDLETHAIKLGDVSLIASDGAWQISFDVQTGPQMRETLPSLGALSDFLEADPMETLVEDSKPTSMIAEIELA